MKFSIAIAIGCAYLALASGAAASNAHVFDPSLSLTGGSGDPGVNHPVTSFNDPCGVTTDAFGDIYVANGAVNTVDPADENEEYDGRIDVFNPNGEFLTEVRNVHQPCSVGVDSEGRMYVLQRHLPGIASPSVVRYTPTEYEPEDGTIVYGDPAEPIADVVSSGISVEGLAVDPANDHLFLIRNASDPWIEDWTEEQREGNAGKNRYGDGEVPSALSMEIWGQTGDIYVSGGTEEDPKAARVYVVDGDTRAVEAALDGSDTPGGKFGFTFGRAGIAVDQSNGDLYVGDIATHHVVDQFRAPGTVGTSGAGSEEYVGQLKLGVNGLLNAEPYSDVAVDAGASSSNQGYVYVTSGFRESNSNLFAFKPLVLEAPEIRNQRAEEVTDAEVLLTAELNPNGAATSYQFEYGPSNCSSGGCQSAPVPAATGGAGGSFEPISVPVQGLQPATEYHFRLLAVSNCNPSEPAQECLVVGPDETFSTFASASNDPCPNSALRVGRSTRLPDCRVYELVTPPDTNGRIPSATLFGETPTTSPPVLLASEDGESLIFGTEGGALPGLGGGGFHDTYVATRGNSGWSSEFSGLNAAEAQKPFAVGASPDHTYSFWAVGGTKGTLANEPGATANAKMTYLRGPGGMVGPIGGGSLGSDPRAVGRWLAPGASHVIFTTENGPNGPAISLEPKAPPTGTGAVYDRLPDGSTRVVSLLPGNVTPAAGEDAEYLGTAASGLAVAFRIGSSIYERIANEKTEKVVDGPALFGGLSADGDRVFYVQSGDIFAFDAATGAASPVGSGGESTMVNVASEGSRVYFVSPVVLTGSEANDQGARAQTGSENLYVWDAASESSRFVAIVEEEDVVGEPPPPLGSEAKVGGLGLWVSDVETSDQDQFLGPANDPSRTSPDGRVFVFESRARLTSYDNDGHSEIYRYDDDAEGLTCISCNPSGSPASSEARLESRYAPRLFSVPPVNALSLIENVVDDGNRVYFETGDALSFEDTDGTNDVYEWEAQGVGDCESVVGCIQLISSGRSATPNFLYGVAADGRDVFFWTGDQLAPQDQSSAPSIYDARELGGFAVPAPSPPCAGDGCQDPPSSPPALTAPSNAALPAARRRIIHHHKKKHHRVKRHRHHHRHGGGQR
jgi:hypothetical protein